MARSIIDHMSTECFRCGNTRNLEVHHIFHGPNRKKSEHYGLKVRLCMHCHRDNKKGVHSDHQFDLDLKRYAQTLFETKYSHNLFVQEFGKNYLSIEEGEDCDT